MLIMMSVRDCILNPIWSGGIICAKFSAFFGVVISKVQSTSARHLQAGCEVCQEHVASAGVGDGASHIHDNGVLSRWVKSVSRLVNVVFTCNALIFCWREKV